MDVATILFWLLAVCGALAAVGLNVLIHRAERAIKLTNLTIKTLLDDS